jgi:hypothetical protein
MMAEIILPRMIHPPLEVHRHSATIFRRFCHFWGDVLNRFSGVWDEDRPGNTLPPERVNVRAWRPAIAPCTVSERLTGAVRGIVRRTHPLQGQVSPVARGKDRGNSGLQTPLRVARAQDAPRHAGCCSVLTGSSFWARGHRRDGLTRPPCPSPPRL